MASWADLRREQPDLASAGRSLLYQHGVGLAFLATVGADGAPRVNPMCPILMDGDVYAFIVPGPKQADLRRDGRFALHSFPCDEDEDAFSLRGRATPVDDPDARRRLGERFVAERSEIGVPFPADDHQLFRLGVDSCLLTRTDGHGDHAPRHTIWKAPTAPSA